MNICQCDTANPLLRDGTSQVQRLLKTLDPSYVAVDERELEDLLVFAKKYAAYLKYYNLDNDPNSEDDWVKFVDYDIATLIAIISRTDTAAQKKAYQQLVENIHAAASKTNLGALFSFILSLAHQIDDWHRKSIEELKLAQDLNLIIKSSLKESLEKLISYIKGAPVVLDVAIGEFGSVWEIDLDLIAPNSDIYAGSSQRNKILAALEEIALEFDTHHNALIKTVALAPDYLIETLEKYPKHPPHFALFLAFLELFKHAQKHLNQLTRLHLEYYYREILQLNKKPAIPDKVHIIFELAKKAAPYAIKKGTALKAGKDITGVNLSYTTDKKLVVNHASVNQLKTIFLEREPDGASPSVKAVYAAPQADSKDGLGTPFDTPEPKWETLGEPQSQKDPVDRTMQDATLGFAIASPQLLLGGGKRIITVTITFGNQKPLPNLPVGYDACSHFSFYLSGEKEWIIPGGQEVEFKNTSMDIVLTLNEDQPPVVAYDKLVLGGVMDTRLPVLKVIMNPNPNPYEFLKRIEIKKIDINLIVSEVRDLILQNDQGILDPNKLFLPFGTAPVLGSAFYIGSQEIFNKKVDKLYLNIDWHGLPENFFAAHYAAYTVKPTESNLKADVAILNAKKWANHTFAADADSRLFDTNLEDRATRQIYLNNILEDRSATIESFTELTHETTRGFIRLKLAGSDFKHREYPKLLTTNIANQVISEDKTTVVIPNEPYTPQISSIKVTYHSNQEFDPQFEQFFHIYPFGEVETRPIALPEPQKASLKNPLIVETPDLTPQFKVADAEQQGLLYIGLADLKPSQNIAILFKIAEGSGDAELAAPKINWCYLQNNSWIKFDRMDLIADTTNGLLTTGIIEFAIPKKATANNTVMPANVHWLRASVEENAAAISQLIDVKAQAVTASFANQKNDPEHLKNPLPAKRISKLEVRVHEIKGVTQPYASFDGKVKELGTEFYRRVSERLRHKNRAINIWDYEHLVLEKYPSIYKVKCLNHTNSHCEIAPGSVTIIPISNLRNQNAVDLLRPKTSLNTLVAIKTYLIRLISPFISLEVKNPFYEQIQVDFEVKFKHGADEGYSANQLNNEIIKFLSPWAFDEGSDIVFGGKIHSSSIIDFIEERKEYVDYITDFKMYCITDETQTQTPVAEVSASSARSILVSAPHHVVRY